MGQYHPDHGWIPEGTEGRAARLRTAKSRFKAAHRPARPIEAAVNNDPDPQRRAATQLMQLVGKADPEDFSVKDVMEALKHERQRLGHDDESKPGQTGAANAALIDELANDVDDRIEEINSREAEPEDDDSYDDDPYEDDDDQPEGDHEDEDAFDWLEQTYGMTGEELADALHELDPEDAQAAVDAFEELYALHLRGYGREAAEQIYLAQLNSGDSDSAEDAAAESYADVDDR